jgi:hypothetical protein
MSTPDSTAKPAASAPVNLQPKPPAIDYQLLEDGSITRTDKDGTITVAILKDGILSISEQWSNFRAPVVRWLNEAGNTPKSIVMQGDEEAVAKAAKRDIPPMPKKSMRLGDKTPEVVAWYKKYHPAEYKARYGIRGPGTVTKTRKVMDPVTGLPTTEVYEQEAVIADRKIAGTEKLEANNATMGGDSGYSDE